MEERGLRGKGPIKTPGGRQGGVGGQLGAMRKRVAWPLILAAIGVAITVAQLEFEQWFLGDVLGVPEEKLALIPHLHHWILYIYRPGERKAEPDRTTIVLIQDRSPCAIRRRLGEIVEKARTYGAAAVVADIIFNPSGTSCPDWKPMEERVQRACAFSPSGIPVIMAFGLDPETGTRLPSVDLTPEGVPSKCARGLANTKHTDLRIIPLDFQSGGRFEPALAWALALEVKPDLETELQSHLHGGPPLYTRPLDDLDFQTNFTISDSEFLTAEHHRDLWPRIRGHVLVVGSVLDKQFQPPDATAPMYGYELHARYIESLLTDRYLHVLPWWADAIVLVITAFGLRLLERREMAHGLLLLIFGTVLIFVVDVFAILVFGYFSAFTSVSLLTVYVWFFAKLKEHQWLKPFFPRQSEIPARPRWKRWLF